ncbi:bifunctional TVP38/TMEM64 family protein/FAD-dependent oxidoreductase [Novosphingobium sp.]|uniref:FAD-dependent oxidoreductase n=1 Tax=Novosphingobium sp. TaxID=1874826 RepID=UPI0022C13F1E|nr:bifunctional TVP38/TMEM64 family protein/FAD-dependent oxidoreductase [Novosphingobium sp.]MCZ8018154.1 FAD-dependent oxidoreductase [Novosphingobium sp.]MCZ8033148.1 FAD-dependent oxidoreductase [Novosphingobium sp.]MCZ8051603.1 FAD-dependent oxidoreductase [Novosphingobium sp.]MCZ8060145.1 FAD-dependent oxidoreductase [Novosphingobium sp.]MCZ8231787.1 FAD-dependent oxidoreductase [Novosphingobium sp.]
MPRLALAALFALALAAWFLFDLGQYLTLENLKAQQAAIDATYRAHPVLVIAGFFLLYVVLTALSVPGAAIMTLAAGAIFGLTTGFVIVSFASTIGATLAFLASRYLFHDAVQARFGATLRPINEGIARDGAFYLFSLRLVPAFPFFAVNLLMGLTPIRVWTYYWVSQVGMVLGTLVYVNAGTQLARIESLKDIASPALLGSFVALGLLPWVGKWIMAALRRRRVYAGFTRPKRYDRNLVVIGAGAAGLVTSLVASTVKAKVTLVEAGKMGGDCLNYGCVPSKALLKSAKVAEMIRRADAYGLKAAEPQHDLSEVMARLRGIIAAIEPNDSVERYTGLGVDVVEGRATIVDPWTVEIARHDGTVQRLTTRAIVIAAGAEPVVPDLPGLAEAGYLTTETLWDALSAMDELPRRIAVLGGGPIGCELSQALARLGADVTQVELGERLLPREDADVAALAQAALEKSGVTVLTGHRALRVEGKVLVAEHDGAERRVEFDALLLAVGRKARLHGYGLEALGIDPAAPLAVDANLATIYPNVFAAGDVIGPYQFTHVASHQAWFAGVNALFGHLKRFKVDYRVIPWTTYIDPEVARVGLNEAEAAAQGIPHEVTLFPLHELDRAIAESATTGFVKVLTPPGKDKILGVTIVGEHAGELLAEYVLAMKHGLGLNKIIATIHMYPTLAEANKFAAGRWKQKHKPERLLNWIGRYHEWRLG